MKDVKKLLIIGRAWSFPMTIIAVLTGAGLAHYYQGFIDPLLLVLVVAGTLLLHFAVNVFNDYYDTIYGVDAANAPTAKYRPHPIFANLASLDQLRLYASTALVLGLAIGVFVALASTPLVLVFAALGALLAYGYTGPPLRLKYHALGELAVLAAWGPLIVGGTYLVVTRGVVDEGLTYSMLASLPLGLLVSAVLLANNIRDIDYDASRGIKTIAIVLGRNGSIKLYQALIIGSYMLHAILVLLGYMPITCVIVFVSLPKALKLVKLFSKHVPDNADPLTAQLVLNYGILVVIGLLLSPLLKLA